MASLQQAGLAGTVRLAPDVNRILFVKYVSHILGMKAPGMERTPNLLLKCFPYLTCLMFMFSRRSLPYKITAEDMYDIFGKYGAIRQIRLGTSHSTRGTAYVVYEDIYEAKNACENLNGFQVAGRYLIVCWPSLIFWKKTRRTNLFHISNPRLCAF